MAFNSVSFGVFLNPGSAGLPSLHERVMSAEQSGFDFVSIQDHPYSPGALDTFILITTLAAATSRIRFMTDVANLPLRPAAMLAKASATIDLVSAGRFDLGLGAGRAWDQIAARGGPRRTPGESVAAIDEAIETLRSAWGTARRGAAAPDLPSSGLGTLRPAHSIEIWLGAAGPRMLGILGRKADGWIAPLATNYETKPAAQRSIDEAALAAGRNPNDVGRMIQVVGSVADGAEHAGPLRGPGAQRIVASAHAWTNLLVYLALTERFDSINFLPQPESTHQIRRFGEEIIPAVRSQLSSAMR